MTLALVFWIVYLVAFVIHISRNYIDRGVLVNSLVYWVLIALLGIGTFGNPIR